ncbi:hypothetical protein KIW84_051683 [Lathyrus oleraceus]|uniref:Uncharacterized protein n=1 Tax=Pisum sativum TaxID=3888 RepID=A0A9D5AAZ7_PEA|nr:hypothetical protein KIW84_051683 [Pisum sativum]
MEKSSQLCMERSKRERATAGTGSISKSISAVATTASNSHAPGTLPSGTIVNPRDQSHIKVVVTRKGRAKEPQVDEQVEEEGLLEVDLEIREEPKQTEEVLVEPTSQQEKQKPKIILPFPTRTKKKDLHEFFLRNS